MNVVLIFYLPVAAIISLFGAAVIEYGFGFAPCDLCIYQRLPWYGLLFLAPLANYIAFRGDHKALYSYIRWVIIALLVASILLSGYHAMVEWNFISGAEQCGSSVPFIRIQNTVTALPSFVSCSDAPFRVLGISPAGFNFILSCLVTLAVLRSKDFK